MKRWGPKPYGYYWYINDCLEVLRTTEGNNERDFDRIQIGNCFKTNKEAVAKKKEILKILNRR